MHLAKPASLIRIINYGGFLPNMPSQSFHLCSSCQLTRQNEKGQNRDYTFWFHSLSSLFILSADGTLGSVAVYKLAQCLFSLRKEPQYAGRQAINSM